MKVALLAIVLLASPAAAREVNFSAHIVDLDGNDIPSSTAKDAPPLDLKVVAATALLAEAPRQDPRAAPPDPTDKLKRFALALKIHKGGAVELSVEEIATLKAAIGADYPALVVGRADEILDPEPHKAQ